MKRWQKNLLIDLVMAVATMGIFFLAGLLSFWVTKFL